MKLYTRFLETALVLGGGQLIALSLAQSLIDLNTGQWDGQPLVNSVIGFIALLLALHHP